MSTTLLQPNLRNNAIIGTFFHAPTPSQLEVLPDTMIVLDEAGTIVDIVPAERPDRVELENHYRDALRLPAGTYGLPGLVDLHVHAPQYPQLGLALDEPLEVWLTKYTFPLEARYADLDFAAERYGTLVEDLLANGTTTALYFATQDRDASKLLADICIAKGQRALVGKVAMDHPDACPETYRDQSPQSAIADTRAVIDHICNHPGNGEGRVLPVITPRFIPSCTDDTLQGLAALAAECNCHVQTHCSENDWAHSHVLARYGITDAAALDRFGLLTRHTVLAHSNFLMADDMDRVARRGSGIAHCALSNIYFANSVFPLRAALERGIRVGLGTDISGGPSASMFNACITTVQSSRMLEQGVDPAVAAEQRGRPQSAVSLVTAFHLATAGGGDVLDLPIGTFAVGQRFDAMAIDTTKREGGIRLFELTDLTAIFEKILYGATRTNIATVWVDGHAVARSLSA